MPALFLNVTAVQAVAGWASGVACSILCNQAGVDRRAATANKLLMAPICQTLMASICLYLVHLRIIFDRIKCDPVKGFLQAKIPPPLQNVCNGRW